MAISARVRDRMIAGLKRLVPIVQQLKARDVSEADTVTIVKDILSEIFGYDKYADLTGEYAIRGTFCDLAIKLDDKLTELVEVKAAGTALDDRHVKQAVDYAANQGVEWVILTNGSIWRLYQVIFAKPIDKRLLTEIDITTIETRKDAHLEQLYPITKEGFLKGAQIVLRDRQDATSRYTLAALLLNNNNVVACIRRELRRIVEVLVNDDEITAVLRNEVLKRDVMEGPEAEAASRRVNRSETKSLRVSKSSNDKSQTTIPAPEPLVTKSDVATES
ncbi:MAG: type I restriction enzyme HsdR N-terminal domain-containing protein [Phycisphaerales bacterium]|nr:type I restriction enzyme HsdR N-terminal domain-containing protein [Phycisphaerales bacterium]